MASRCCGNRLSLPNQYDTQTPARVSRCGHQEAASTSGPFVARPDHFSGTLSRHESVARRWYRNGPSRNSTISAKKNLDKILRAFRPPDLCLANSGQVLENVAPAEGLPQAVHKYRFLHGTSSASQAITPSATANLPLGATHVILLKRLSWSIHHLHRFGSPLSACPASGKLFGPSGWHKLAIHPFAATIASSSGCAHGSKKAAMQASTGWPLGWAGRTAPPMRNAKPST